MGEQEKCPRWLVNDIEGIGALRAWGNFVGQMKIWRRICSLIRLFGSLVLGCGCGSNNSLPHKPAEKAGDAERPFEYILAYLDGGHLDQDGPTVGRFRILLDTLTEKFVENRKQIADMTVRSREILKNKKVEESLLNIMEGINTIMPRSIGNQKYAEYAAAYISLRLARGREKPAAPSIV